MINLRAFHSDRDAIGTNSLATEHISIKTWRPEREDVVRFLALATNTNRTPVFVHCQHGSHRRHVRNLPDRGLRVEQAGRHRPARSRQ